MFKGNNKEIVTKILVDERIKYKLNSFNNEKNVVDFNSSIMFTMENVIKTIILSL